MNEKEAYLVGTYLGNGSIAGNRFSITNFDLDVTQNVAWCIQKLFGRDVDIRENSEEQNWSEASCCHKPLVEWLVSLTGNRKHIPDEIFESPMEIKKILVAGLMDTDGWIAENKATKWHVIHEENRWYQAGIAATAPWIFELRRLLQSCGVRCGVVNQMIDQKKHPEWNPCYRYYINLKTFCREGFYFLNDRKQQRLERYKAQVLGWDISSTPSETIPTGSRARKTRNAKDPGASSRVMI